MKDKDKSKDRLIKERVELRQRIADLEASERERNRAEEALWKRTHDLGERVKELDCLYGASKLMAEPGRSLDEIIQGIVDLIPASWE